MVRLRPHSRRFSGATAYPQTKYWLNDLFPWLVLLVLSFSSEPLWAHQLQESETQIVINAEASRIEVSHRLNFHDAEHAAQPLFGVTLDVLNNDMARRHFANYVAKQFLLHNLTGQDIALDMVGYEIKGQDLWIYQQADFNPVLDGLTIKQNVFHDVWEAQVNLVEVDYSQLDPKARIVSLVFEQTTEAKQVHFSARTNH